MDTQIGILIVFKEFKGFEANSRNDRGDGIDQNNEQKIGGGGVCINN